VLVPVALVTTVMTTPARLDPASRRVGTALPGEDPQPAPVT
jgi:hypothetical protein